MNTPNWRKLIGIGRIVEKSPPGLTPCGNGKFSTFRKGRGVCSYNGGVMFPLLKEPSVTKDYRGLVTDFENIAQQIATLNNKWAKVNIWKNRRLYINYEGYPKSAQNGGFIDLDTGYIDYPTRGSGYAQKERNSLLDKIKQTIFDL